MDLRLRISSDKASFVLCPRQWNIPRKKVKRWIGGHCRCSPLGHDSVALSPTKRATLPNVEKPEPSPLSHAYHTSSQHVHGPNTTMANGVPIPESKILRSRDPADNDENNWATFDLRNVEVVNKKGKLVNLLHADAAHPVTVTGTLQLNKGNAGLCMCSHSTLLYRSSFVALLNMPSLTDALCSTANRDEIQERHNSN